MPDPVDDPNNPDPNTPPAPAPSPPPDPKPADDPAAMAAALKKANDEAKKYRLDLATATKQLDELKAQQMTDTEKAIAEAVATATTSADEKWRSRVLAAEIKAHAAGKVIDPDLVVKLIDGDAVSWDGDDLDVKKLRESIDKLVEQRPYLAAGVTPATPQVPAGARGSEPQITAEQIKSMTPEQVEEAFRKGQLSHLMAGA